MLLHLFQKYICYSSYVASNGPIAELLPQIDLRLGGRDDDLKLPQLGLLTVSLTTSKIIV